MKIKEPNPSRLHRRKFWYLASCTEAAQFHHLFEIFIPAVACCFNLVYDTLVSILNHHHGNWTTPWYHLCEVYVQLVQTRPVSNVILVSALLLCASCSILTGYGAGINWIPSTYHLCLHCTSSSSREGFRLSKLESKIYSKTRTGGMRNSASLKNGMSSTLPVTRSS